MLLKEEGRGEIGGFTGRKHRRVLGGSGRVQDCPGFMAAPGRWWRTLRGGWTPGPWSELQAPFLVMGNQTIISSVESTAEARVVF